MPLIQVQSTEEPSTPVRSGQITSKITNAMVSIEGENLCPAAWIDIENFLSDEWDIGGPAMNTGVVGAVPRAKNRTNPKEEA